MSSIHLSIIIPTIYSYEYIIDTIDSVTAELEGYVEFEIIVVNDGGDEFTQEILFSYNNKRLKAFRLSRNYGQHIATIFGIYQSIGEFIITFDDDLKYAPKDILELYRVTSVSDFDITYGFIRDKDGRNLLRNLADWLAGKPFATSFRCVRRKLLTDFLFNQLEVYLFNQKKDISVQYLEVLSYRTLKTRTSWKQRLIFILFMFPKFKNSKLYDIIYITFILFHIVYIINMKFDNSIVKWLLIIDGILFFISFILYLLGRIIDPFRRFNLAQIDYKVIK